VLALWSVGCFERLCASRMHWEVGDAIEISEILVYTQRILNRLLSSDDSEHETETVNCENTLKSGQESFWKWCS
jgi:hypothetical protein